MPDIVCLRELKAPDERFPRRELQRAGYEAVWHGQKSWNGVAILAKGKMPVLTRRSLPGDPDDVHSRYIEAAAYADLVAQGWTDAIRHLHPGERIYTFWKYWRNSFERDAGLRVDHALLSPALAPWLRSASVRRHPWSMRRWE